MNQTEICEYTTQNGPYPTCAPITVNSYHALLTSNGAGVQQIPRILCVMHSLVLVPVKQQNKYFKFIHPSL